MSTTMTAVFARSTSTRSGFASMLMTRLPDGGLLTSDRRVELLTWAAATETIGVPAMKARRDRRGSTLGICAYYHLRLGSERRRYRKPKSRNRSQAINSRSEERRVGKECR